MALLTSTTGGIRAQDYHVGWKHVRIGMNSYGAQGGPQASVYLDPKRNHPKGGCHGSARQQKHNPGLHSRSVLAPHWQAAGHLFTRASHERSALRPFDSCMTKPSFRGCSLTGLDSTEATIPFVGIENSVLLWNWVAWWPTANCPKVWSLCICLHCQCWDMWMHVAHKVLVKRETSPQTRPLSDLQEL